MMPESTVGPWLAGMVAGIGGTMFKYFETKGRAAGRATSIKAEWSRPTGTSIELPKSYSSSLIRDTESRRVNAPATGGRASGRSPALKLELARESGAPEVPELSLLPPPRCLRSPTKVERLEPGLLGEGGGSSDVTE